MQKEGGDASQQIQPAESPRPATPPSAVAAPAVAVAAAAVESMQKVKEDVEKALQHVDTIDACAQHQKMIADDVLDLSKLALGKIDLVPAPFALRAVFHNLVTMFAPSMQLAGLSCSANIADLYLLADAGRLMQVLVNLLSNAIKFTPEGGRITLSADVIDSSGQLRVVVKDNGVGMDPEQLERVSKVRSLLLLLLVFRSFFSFFSR